MSQFTLELKTEMVKAGAGAGKTRSLVEKVIEVFELSQHRLGRAPHIIVSTFTRKATQELKERLLLEACRRENPQLIEYMSDGTRLHISTIHGLLNLFLRQVAHLAELDSGFQIMDETAAKRLRQTVLREVLVKNPESLKWLERFGFDRLLQMCTNWSHAQFERQNLIPATLEDLEAEAQKHSQMVRAQLLELSARVLEEADDLKWQEYGQALAVAAKSWNGRQDCLELPKKASISAKLAHLAELNEELMSALKKIKESCESRSWNREIWPQFILEWKEFAPLAESFHSHLQQQKKRMGQLEMADLEFYAIDLLREKPFLAEMFSQAWDYWMIDEFQDTSQIQTQILRQLIGAKPAYYVGDPQQSIYLFRGARSQIFIEQWSQMIEQGHGTRSLQKNYRSEPSLLHFINHVVTELGEQFASMEPNLDKAVAGGLPVAARLARAHNIDLERSYVVNQIIGLVKSGVSLEKICILGRTHHQLLNLATLLKNEGLATHVHSPSGFWSRRETKDIFSLWRFLLNPHDNENLVTLLRSPYFYVPDGVLASAASSRPQSLWRKLSHQEPTLWAIQNLVHAIGESESKGVVAGFEWALNKAGVFDLALKSDPAGRKESNLWKFLSRVKELEREGGSAFLSLEPGTQEEGTGTEGDAASSQEPNCINLMTIHGSKGLEFDHVIVPHMGQCPRVTNSTSFAVKETQNGGHFSFSIFSEEEGEFISSPLEKKWVEERRLKEREESQRWLYVALTRAKKSLLLTTSEIEEGSWASQIALFKREAGEFTTKDFRIAIEDISDSERIQHLAEDKKVIVRSPFLNLHDPAQNKVDLNKRQSVTEILKKSDERPLPAKVIFAIAQRKSEGVLIHKWLEALRFSLAKGEEVAFADQFALDERIVKGLNFTQELKKPPMMELLKAGQPEWGFQIQTKIGLLEGQIDLWGIVGNELWVVDYKSGSEEFKEGAFDQLALYSWALRKFGYKHPIQRAVIYPMSQSVEVRPFDEKLLLHWENKFSGS